MTEGINIGNLSEMINDKMDRDLMNSLIKTDFVVESKAPDENDPSWYRIYKSGWIEQGGRLTKTVGQNASQVVTLPKVMANTYYTSLGVPSIGGGDTTAHIDIVNTSATQISIYPHWSSTGQTLNWEVKGFVKDNTMEGDEGETVFGNVYKTYFYSGTDLDYSNIVGPKTPVEMASYSFPKSGVIMGWINPVDNNTCRLKINNQIVYGADYYCTSVYIPVKKDDIFSYEGIDNPSTIAQNSLWFVPYSEPAQSTNPTVTQIIDAIYPVGSIYIGTTVNCPIASIVGTWEKIDGDLVLQSSSSSHQAGTTIEAGLPNITGNLLGVYGASSAAYNWGFRPGTNGAFSVQEKIGIYNKYGGDYSAPSGDTANFDASRSSSIYGNSNTVQPPAYVVNIWKRTA